MKYQINLITDLRRKESKNQLRDSLITISFVFLMAILLMTVFKSTLFIISMNRDLGLAQKQLSDLQTEYKRYQATSMSIEKEDLELLDRLQHQRIFWTKKLSSLANPLPENYWVNSIEYKKSKLSVEGLGYLDKEQRQLITIDDYLNILRTDSIFNKGMPLVALVETRRDDLKEKGTQQRERVSYKFTAQEPKAKAPVAVKSRKK